jgi:ABC-type multidrug transport system fused ATPase/permease subunit
MIRVLKGLWVHIELRRRYQLGALLMLMLLASVAEMFSIGAVIPFLSVMADPARAMAQPSIQLIFEWFNLTEEGDLLAVIAIGFGVASLFAGLVRVILIYFSTRLSYAIGADLSARIYLNTLFQPYIRHLSRNSSEVITGITSKSSNVINGALVPALMIVNSSMLLISVIGLLSYIDPLITLGAIASFGGIYLGITLLMKRWLAINGTHIAKESVQVLRCLQEGLGGIREVLLEGNQERYCEEYRKSDRVMRRAQGSNLFITQFPRFAMEGLGLFMIAMFAYVETRLNGDLGTLLPTLGVLALGASRMLPVLQHTYGSWANIQGNMAEIEDVLALLDKSTAEKVSDYKHVEQLRFIDSIALDRLCFSYGAESVLREVSVTLQKGDCIGIVGRSGSGKSTLVDIIMGLLDPSSGSIRIDGQRLNRANLRSWQRLIAHVPQTIFLVDGNIADNIAFGLPDRIPTDEELYRAAIAAGLGDIVQRPEDLYRIHVGERGARISGGQRQRIAIARALLRQADLIVFDEATSALDEKTEADIVSMIQRLDHSKTIIIISHRMAALRNCNRILRIDGGKLSEQPSSVVVA